MPRPARRWTDEEKAYLSLNAKRFTAEYMGLRLKRSESSVRTMARRMDISLGGWTDEDMQFLRDNAWCMTAKQIGIVLDREEGQVKKKAQNMGVRFGPKRNNFTARQDRAKERYEL